MTAVDINTRQPRRSMRFNLDDTISIPILATRACMPDCNLGGYRYCFIDMNNSHRRPRVYSLERALVGPKVKTSVSAGLVEDDVNTTRESIERAM